MHNTNAAWLVGFTDFTIRIGGIPIRAVERL